MRCPFIVKVVKRIEPQFDESGNKIGEEVVEEVERGDCLKGDCMIFSTDKNQCSFVSVQETVSAFDGLAARSVDNIVTRAETIIKERFDSLKNEMTTAISNLTTEISKADEQLYNLQKVGLEKILSFVSGGYESAKGLGFQLTEFKSAIDSMAKEQIQAFEGLSLKIGDSIKDLGERINAILQEFDTRHRQSQEELTRNLTSLSERIGQELHSGFEGFKSEMSEDIGRLLDADVQTRERVGKGLDDLVQGVSSLSGQIKQDLGGNIDEVKVKISDEFGRFIEAESQMREKMIAALDDVGQRVDGLKENLSQYLKQQEERINQVIASEKSYRENSTQRIEAVFNNLKESLSGAIAGMQGEISSQIDKIGEFGKNYQVWIDSAVGGFKESLERAVEGMKREVGAQIEKIDTFEKQHQAWMEEVLKEIRGFFESEQAFLKAERERRQLEEADRLNEMAILDYHRGNYESALTSIKKALELNEKAEFYANLGMIHTDLNNVDDARSAFEKALQLNPNSAEIYNNLGVLNYRIKDFEQAVNAFNEAIKRRRNYPNAYLHLGKAFLELEKFDDAIKTWEKVLEIDPENSEAQGLLKMYKEGRINGHTEEA